MADEVLSVLSEIRDGLAATPAGFKSGFDGFTERLDAVHGELVRVRVAVEEIVRRLPL